MKRVLYWLLALGLVGCAGWQRDCAGCNASNFGSDWLIVQFDMHGKPFNCWKLQNVPVENEPSSDGIYWQAQNGHLVHISGWYNRVQVRGSNFDGAARAVGVDLAQCGDGRYGK